MLNTKILNYSIEEINQEPNTKIRNELFNLYHELIIELSNNRISRKVIMENNGKSIKDLMTIINNISLLHESIDIFQGDYVILYPSITEAVANREITCDVSGSKIKIGSKYYSYRPLLDNIVTKKRYVLKRTIKTEIGYDDFFPKDIHEFEDLNYKLSHPFEYLNDQNYNYYDISTRVGEGLTLEELNKGKKLIKK